VLSGLLAVSAQQALDYCWTITGRLAVSNGQGQGRQAGKSKDSDALNFAPDVSAAIHTLRRRRRRRPKLHARTNPLLALTLHAHDRPIVLLCPALSQRGACATAEAFPPDRLPFLFLP
jgi:hypothetical protein